MELSIADYIYSEVERKRRAGIEPACVTYTDVVNKVLSTMKSELTSMRESGFIRLRKGVNDWLIFTDEGNEEQK